MVKAVIFDVDGTLIDSVDLHAQAWVDAIHDFGFDPPFADVRAQIGKGADQLMPVFLSPEQLAEMGEKLEKHRSEVMKERYLPRIKAFPRVRELFQRLKDDGIQVALASSAKADELEVYKREAGIEDMVDTETSSDDAKKSKPHPDIFDAALGRLKGIDPADILVVGDTPYDAEAAAKAGLRTVGVLCGGFPEDGLRAAGCIAVYLDPADLLARYEQSPLAQPKGA